MSLRDVRSRSPLACSGLMYCGVPTERPVCVSVAPPASVAAEGARDAEVGEQRVAALREQQILRLDVAMHDALLVRVVERTRDLARDAQRLVDRELLVATEMVAQRLALDVGHREPELAVGGLAGIQHGEDVRMRERGGEADLAPEALGAKRGREIGVEHLERDLAAVLLVRREIDRGHAATPQLTQEFVLGAEYRLQLVQPRRRHPFLLPGKVPPIYGVAAWCARRQRTARALRTTRRRPRRLAYSMEANALVSEP